VRGLSRAHASPEPGFVQKRNLVVIDRAMRAAGLAELIAHCRTFVVQIERFWRKLQNRMFLSAQRIRKNVANTPYFAVTQTMVNIADFLQAELAYTHPVFLNSSAYPITLFSVLYQYDARHTSQSTIA